MKYKYNREMIEALHSYFWYQGFLDQDGDEWIDFKDVIRRPKYREDDAIHTLIRELRKDDTKNFSQCEAEELFKKSDLWWGECEVIWIMLVAMFGDYGVSPRVGWIDCGRRNECAEFLDIVVQSEELGLTGKLD